MIAAAGAAAAENGVTATEIVFGQSAALSGPAEALGKGMQLGIQAAFEEANRAGGVHGRTLSMTSLDDGYEPERAISNTRALIDGNKVFALIGAVGTPTSKAAQPIATQENVPYLGAFTGAGFLRNPSLGNVINYRASYAQETEAWIKHLTEDLKYEKIAILYQDDSFGRVGLDGVTAALEKRGMALAAKGTYQRNTTAVRTALLEIRKAKPEAVVMVGAYKPIAEFVKLARKVKMDATFVNISFVGSNALAQELGPEGSGVVITQVVPFPWDESVPVVADYAKALKALDPAAEPGFVSLEGYMVGRMTIAALEKAGPELTRDALLNTFYSGASFDLGGKTLSFGPDDVQGSDEVYLTIIKPDGSFLAVDDLNAVGTGSIK
ncbi:MAG: ABC transporter substrate-binding protein [Pseudomonadota bacterium]